MFVRTAGVALAAWVGLCGAAAVGPFGAVQPKAAGAAEFRWTNTSSNNAWFDLSSNWALHSGSGTAPPGPADDARFNQAATYNVNWDSLTGNRTNTHLTLTAGNVTFRSTGGLFTYTLTGNTLIQIGTLTLGSSASNRHVLQTNGTMDVYNGGAFHVRFGSQATVKSLWVGGFGAPSTVLVDGAGSTLDLSAGLEHRIGVFGGTGNLTFQNGASGTVAAVLALAQSGGANSVGNLSILSGSTLTAVNITAGTSGLSGQSGTINLQGIGSAITQTGTSILTLGAASTSPGTLNIGTTSGNTATVFTTGTGNTTINPTGTINIGGNLVGQQGTFNANGNVILNGGTLNRRSLGVFNLAPGRSLTANNNATVSFAGNYRLGGGSTFTIQGGSSFSVTQFLDIGSQASSNGNLMINGSGSSLNVTGVSFSIIGGSTSTGGLTLQNNASATYNGNVHLAASPGSTGNLTVLSGSGMSVPSLYVGGGSSAAGGTGNVTVGGGSLNVANTLRVWNNGQVNLSGASWIRAAALQITGGQFTHVSGSSVSISSAGAFATGHVVIGQGTGSGLVHITDGGRLNTATAATLARDSGSTGQAIISGPGSSWINGGQLWVGSFGIGGLTVQQGAALSSADAFVGQFPGSTGLALVTGPGSSWTVSGSLHVGGREDAAGGIGSLTIDSGALLALTDVLQIWNQGTVYYDGGTITAPTIRIRGGGKMLLYPGADKVLLTGPAGFIETAAGSFLDLSDNEMVVEGADPASMSSLVASGYAGGSWNGPGINSSAAAVQPGRALGVAPDGSAVRVKFTWAGDANLDGGVNISDLSILAGNWQQTNRLWHQGDFNYDGIVNVSDLSLLAANWQEGLAGSSMSFHEAMGMFDTFEGIVIPEPASLALLGFGMVGLTGRRRTWRSDSK